MRTSRKYNAVKTESMRVNGGGCSAGGAPIVYLISTCGATTPRAREHSFWSPPPRAAARSCTASSRRTGAATCKRWCEDVSGHVQTSTVVHVGPASFSRRMVSRGSWLQIREETERRARYHSRAGLHQSRTLAQRARTSSPKNRPAYRSYAPRLVQASVLWSGRHLRNLRQSDECFPPTWIPA